ncbi:TetR family transcriptional regulator [Mycobacteroides chelonae]|uniref:TetR/AcrR family transcriptional regulator n=1 Tax=Mycobacteroides chelonae TaxID=1774 RepID=UPI0008A9D71F|nr:TetR/AcrR family transcriptional regulator [Mycobacteroides chelonae]OHT78581.1 TetR family transcriptional regulator [Mycobacteroides chelonae]
MVRPAQTVRSERTRAALRQAAIVRFLGQGVEDTSVEQIAADAGVSLRTFYRHFESKHDLLFPDYDLGLEWFRSALDARIPGEPILESVESAIFSAPYDVDAVVKIATLRNQELDRARIVRHIRQVEAEFAEAIEEHLIRDGDDDTNPDVRLRNTVTARSIAAAVFGAMDAWMLGENRSPEELARLSRTALDFLKAGIGDAS